MLNYRDVVLDPMGSPIQDVDVTVYLYNTTTPADIFNKNSTPISSTLRTNRTGEFEFHARNGRYTLGFHHPSFENGLAKFVDISILDINEIEYTQVLQGSVLDNNGRILMDTMPFRLFVCNTMTEMLSLSTRPNDIVIRKDLGGTKYIKNQNTTGTINDWDLSEPIASVAGRRGSITLTTSDISDFNSTIVSMSNRANGILLLDQNTKIQEQFLPLGGSILRMVDEITGSVYRMTISDGEVVLRPVL
jgi:hypothetical protein